MNCGACGKRALDLNRSKGEWALLLDDTSPLQHIVVNELANVVHFDATLIFWRHPVGAKPTDKEADWHLRQCLREIKQFKHIVVSGTDAFWYLTEDIAENHYGLWTADRFIATELFAVPTPEMMGRLGLGEMRLAVQKLEKQYGKIAKDNRVGGAGSVRASEVFGKGTKRINLNRKSIHKGR